MFNEIFLVSAAGLLLARAFCALCVVHSWFHSVKMYDCCFYAFPLCCGTPDDPAVAPVEAGHCEGGRGGGGKGRRA